MITDIALAHLAAEHAVLHRVVHEDDRQHDHGADQREQLARMARRRIPDRQRRRHDVRPDADHEPRVAEEHERERQQERRGLVRTLHRVEDAPHARDDEDRHRQEPAEVAAAEPAVRDGRQPDHGPQAHHAHHREQHARERLHQQPHLALQFAVDLQDQPAAAERRIGDEHADPAHHAERRQPVERPARELVVLDLDALQQRTEHDPLAERRQRRAADEREVPHVLRAGGFRAQLERRAPEDQPDQHQHQRQVVGRQQRRIHDRERAIEARAAEHEERLVAVPHRRDGVEHHLALGLRVEERKQQTDAEIEAVQHHVDEYAEADDRGPDDRKIDMHGYSASVTFSGVDSALLRSPGCRCSSM
ncbi:Cytochrome bd-type quinol oxidase, subunit 2 [Burkholderia cenocepacia PC184]|nr:Cytochrome bd-type quinol oxidase, subunit 2 [Burkholderia cenocepacia PC184]